MDLKNTASLEAMKEKGRNNREMMKMDNQRRVDQQRNSAKSVKRFESSGNDIVTGDAGMDRF